MRRSLAALAAAVLLVSSVGGATGAEPDASPSLAPIVEPSPSADPAPSAGPSASDPVVIPGTDPAVAPTDAPALAPVTHEPAEPVPAPIVEASTPSEIAARAATDPTDRWIVVLKPGTDVTSAVGRQGRRIGFAADRTYGNALHGYAAKLDRSKVVALSHDPSVEMIVADERIVAAPASPRLRGVLDQAG